MKIFQNLNGMLEKEKQTIPGMLEDRLRNLKARVEAGIEYFSCIEKSFNQKSGKLSTTKMAMVWTIEDQTFESALFNRICEMLRLTQEALQNIGELVGIKTQHLKMVENGVLESLWGQKEQNDLDYLKLKSKRLKLMIKPQNKYLENMQSLT